MCDLISRQAAIDAIKGLEFCHYMEFGEYIGEDTREVRLIRAEKAQDALQKLPSAQPEVLAHGEGELSAQPEPQWIPGNERIPEGLIIVQFNDGDFDLLQFPTGYRRKDIVAWMPLPEPWKGEQP